MISRALDDAYVPQRHRELISRLVASYSSQEDLDKQVRRWKAVLQDTWNL